MAVIYVSPATNITEFIASVAVTPGDVLIFCAKRCNGSRNQGF